MKLKFEHVLCNICKQNNSSILFRIDKNKTKFNVVMCNNCKLAYLNPRLTQDQLQKVYVEDQLINFEYYLASKKLDEKTFAARLNLIKKFISVGTVLDIGSSIGTFLSVAKSEGWRAYGIELNKKSAEYSKACGHKLFDDYEKTKLKFNFVNMSDVIEHFTDPKEELTKIYNLLCNDGVLLISTPNFENKLTRKLAIKPYEHLYYFTPKTISLLLNKCGFMVKYFKPTTRNLSVKALIYSSTFNRSKLKLLLLSLLIHTRFYMILDKIINNLNPDMLIVAQKIKT